MKLEKWGVFLHKNIIFDNFDKIREEIEDETDRVAGANKGIVAKAINLKIFSPNVVDLTLVDLPGITKVPVGDQPADIEKQINDLVLEYIENPNCIILAVTAANMDLATSEALKIAKNIDPEGHRTLAVLTKLDLMDEGTDATEVLTGSVIPVKLGIVGVVNRSQKDIIDKKEMDDQLDKESKFLAGKYPMLASKNGTPYLAKTLSRLLMNHINKCLPDLRQRVLSKSSEVQDLLRLYGKETVDKDQSLVQILTQFSKCYTATIEGVKAGVEGTCGKTHIYQIIHEKLEKDLNRIEPCIDLSAENALSALTNAAGPRPTLFDDPSFDSPFEEIVKKQVALLRIPVLVCVDEVHKEMVRNIRNCGNVMQQELERFPKLRNRIADVVAKLLRNNRETTKTNVEHLIGMEIAYVNKKHPDFDKEAARLINFSENGEEGDLRSIIKKRYKCFQYGKVASFDEEQLKQCLILERLVSKYFNIIRKSIQDSVPKAVIYFLVNSTRDEVSNELLKQLYKSTSAEDMLNESDHVVKGRRHAKEMLDVISTISLYSIMRRLTNHFFSIFRLS